MLSPGLCMQTLPYWGSPHERKVIRKYWNQVWLYLEKAMAAVMFGALLLEASVQGGCTIPCPYHKLPAGKTG